MTVLDVSRSGLKTKISQMRLKTKDHHFSAKTAGKGTFDHNIQLSDDDLNVGDELWVEFQLDDAKRSQVSKEVIIRWVDLPYIGVEFLSIPVFDPDLGYYMMS